MESKPPFEVVIGPTSTKDQSTYGTLTVEQALQYTPLITSPLQPSDQIPLPSISQQNSHVPLVSPRDRKAISQTPYDSEVQKKVQKLLRAEGLAEIKFKRTPKDNQQPRTSAALTPLAKEVLRDTHIDYCFPKPTIKHEVANHLPPKQAPSSLVRSQSSSFVVEIPQQKKIKTEDYVTIPDSPKRRKLANEARDAEVALRLQTQKEQGDIAIGKFQELLFDILEEQDVLAVEIDNGQVPTERTAYFEPPDEEEDYKLRLSTTASEKVHTHLKHLSAFGRIGDLRKDYIKGLQKLCENSIDASQSLSLRLSGDLSEDDVHTWKTQCKKAENAMLAAMVYLQLAIGTKEDETSASAEVLKCIPNILVKVFESCLIPVMESRSDGTDNDVFNTARDLQNDLRGLLDLGRKSIDLLAAACVDVQTASECINATEFLAAKLIFVQNASTDKAAALGTQPVERVRKQAMSSLARVYAAFPNERGPILDEVLVSLDKLPSTSRSARQYKLKDGVSIMLVTALFTQLVQTASLETTAVKATRKSRNRRERVNGEHVPSTENDNHEDDSMHEASEQEAEEDAISQLKQKVEDLYNPATRSAHEIVLYMVGKASRVSKTGDSPYRNILDLFVEDLVNLLPMPEWPSAELLLRLLASRTSNLVQNEKSASIKNMSLELLGQMGSAISATRATAQTLASSLSREPDQTGSGRGLDLAQIANDHFEGVLSVPTLIGNHGPFILTCDHYATLGGESLRSKSARSFFLAQYAKFLCTIAPAEDNEDSKVSGSVSIAATELLGQIVDAGSDSSGVRRSSSSPREAQLAYLLSVLNLGFCRWYEGIVRKLLDSLHSDQAQVRSRSLKSVVTILETDPGLLDRDPTLADSVFEGASDDSALVREAAISLIAKFIISKPALEEKAFKRLLAGASDNKVGVQKRSIGHLADLYSQDERPKLKAAIAKTFLQCTADNEDSVSELAKKTLMDIWITPNLNFTGEKQATPQATVSLQELASHISDCLQFDTTELPELFTDYLKWLIKMTKTGTKLITLLKDLVKTLFQAVIEDNGTQPNLMVLMSIAEAEPRAVAPQQLSHLRQYLSFVKSEEELPMFKSVIGIFRHVLPGLSSTHESLLKDIQQDLFQSITKLARRIELDEVMSCLKTINGVLKNSGRLAKLLASIVNQICDPKQTDTVRLRIIRIAGSMGKFLDLDDLHINGYVKGYEGGSVASFLADVIYPHAVKGQFEPLQTIALESLGAICQSWPVQFNKKHISGLFKMALAGDQNSQSVLPPDKARNRVLTVFEEMFGALAALRDDANKEDGPEEHLQDLKKMGGSAKAQDNNSAISSIANAIKGLLTKIALGGLGDDSLSALRTITSISHCGLFHPRDYAFVFVALETCPDTATRSVAEKAHALLHQHHESHLEREYIGAVQKAFTYQQSIQTGISDLVGMRVQGKDCVAKLTPCFDIINTGGSKVIKKFLSNLISRMTIDYTKIDVDKNPIPDHVLFIRFVAQNLAFFEYSKVEDLLHVILQLERLFSKTGDEVSQAIQERLPPRQTPQETSPQDEQTAETLTNGSEQTGTHAFSDQVMASEGNVQSAPSSMLSSKPIDMTLLKRLAAAASAVTVLSDTKVYLKQQYGIRRNTKDAMQQSKDNKEATKAPMKVHGITPEKYLVSTEVVFVPLTVEHQPERQLLKVCWDFVDLMAVDEEVRVSDEGDEFRQSYSAGLEEDTGQQDVSRKGKKRKSAPGSIGGTPKKARGRPRKNAVNGNRRSKSVSSFDEDPEGDFLG